MIYLILLYGGGFCLSHTIFEMNYLQRCCLQGILTSVILWFIKKYSLFEDLFLQCLSEPKWSIFHATNWSMQCWPYSLLKVTPTYRTTWLVQHSKIFFFQQQPISFVGLFQPSTIQQVSTKDNAHNIRGSYHIWNWWWYHIRKSGDDDYLGGRLALADTPVFKKMNIFFEWIGRNLFWMNNFWIEWDPLTKEKLIFFWINFFQIK